MTEFNELRVRKKAVRLLVAFVTLVHLAAILVRPLKAGDEWDAAAETLVIYNPDFAGSESLARHYAGKRGIPEDRLLALPCAVTEDISRADFDTQIRQPLRRHFSSNRWWIMEDAKPSGDSSPSIVRSCRIRVIAIIRGIPCRVVRSQPPSEVGQEDEASVDSELALLGLDSHPLPGFVPNPFFESAAGFHQLKNAAGMILVSRLDGPDDATVRRMIDDAVAVESSGLSGRAVLDYALKEGAYEMGEEWLRRCALLYRAQGIPVFEDRFPDLIPAHWPLPDTALYFGWYRDRVSGVFADEDFRFVKGAVVCHLHSFSASKQRSSENGWTGPLLLKGATATLGNVWEPYLPLTCHFDLFNKRLLEGATLAEAACFATPALSWMQVVIGDPLYRPFKTPASSSLGQEGRLRDYALYQGLAGRQPDEKDNPGLQRHLLKLAEKRHNPHLLELLGLLSNQDGQTGAAVDLFDHAANLYPPGSSDQQRVRLYQADALRQLPDLNKCIQVLEGLPDQPASKALLEKLRPPATPQGTP